MSRIQLTEEQIRTLAQAAYDASDWEGCRNLLSLLPGEAGRSGMGCSAAYESGKANLAAGNFAGARVSFRLASAGMVSPATMTLSRDRVSLLSTSTRRSVQATRGSHDIARVKPVRRLAATALAPHVDRVHCLAAYRSGYDVEKGDALSRSIRRMKRGNARTTAVALGQALADLLIASTDLQNEADLIVPVPSDWQRAAARGYSIAEILADEVSKRCAIPVYHQVLQAAGDIPELRYIPRHRRAKAILGVYSVAEPELVRGRHVIIIDDVITSGATVTNIARELKSSGATVVSVLAIAHSESSMSTPE